MREVNYDERWKVARDLACKINLWPTVENLRHLDAALRRAKAEGMREIRQLRRHLRVALDHAEQHHEGCLYCGEGEIVDGDTTPAHRAKCWYYKASRAALLGLVQAYQQAVSAVQSLPPTIDEFTRRGKALENAQEDLYTYRASLLCQEKQRLALPMPKRTVLEPFGEKASRFTIHYDGGHPGCKVVIESADGALDAIAELLTDEYRKQSSLPAHRAKLAQGGAGKHACDLPGCVSCGNPPDTEGETRA